VCLAISFAACGGSSADPPAAPPPRACGALEVSHADGTCSAVGVTTCGPSARADGAGGCTAILPETCPAGSLAVLGETTCTAIGPTSADVEPESCADGKMIVPGETACRAVAECGDGTWGAIPVDGTTVYVDAGAASGGDGSAARPFTTIAAAVTVATGTLAIAAGTYAETVETDRPIKLYGRCPARVTINGSVTLRGASEVHTLSVTSSGVGITAGKTLLVDRVHVHDTGGIGVRAYGGATQLTVRDSLIERASTTGIYGEATTLTVERTHVRDMRPRPSDGAYGRGIHVQDDPSGKGATLTLRGSLVDRAREVGVYVQGSDATIDSTRVRDTAGRGIHVQFDRATKHAASLTAQNVTVIRAVEHGIYAFGARATLRDVRVSGVALDASGVLGHGVTAVAEDATKTRAVVDAERVLIEGVSGAGVLLKGAEAKLKSAIIRDVAARTSDRLKGYGVHVAPDAASGNSSSLSLERSLIERAVAAGVMVESSLATIDRCTVRDTRVAPASGAAGNAVQLVRGEVEVRASILEESVHAGLLSLGGTLRVTDSLVRRTKPTGEGVGVGVGGWPYEGARSTISVARTIVEANAGYGLHVIGGDATFEDCTVRDTRSLDGELPLGVGVGIQSDTATLARSSATLRRLLVDLSSTVGVGVSGSTVEAEGLLVRKTSAAANGLFGDGLGVARTEKNECAVTLAGSLLTENARGGVVAIGAELSVKDTSLTCNRIDLDVEPANLAGQSFAASLKDGGGALCGCGAALRSCKAQSANLAPAPLK